MDALEAHVMTQYRGYQLRVAVESLDRRASFFASYHPSYLHPFSNAAFCFTIKNRIV